MALNWTRPQFTKGQIDKAARTLVDDNAHFGHKNTALLIVNNWRAAHSFPLNTFQVTLRKRAQEIDQSRLVAQRIKRMTSIEAKLRRFPGMRMTQMQDIGGCRAILSSVAQVEELVKRYRRSDIKHRLDDLDDYIARPKESGYRGVHMIYRYNSDREGPSVYNGLFIEMQIRTRLQHTWATAVETVGTFLSQALKSSMGEEQWLRFFSLMGSVFAIKEGCELVPGTPGKGRELLREIREIEKALNVRNALAMYQQAIRVAREGPERSKNHYYLLILEPQKLVMTVRGFPRSALVEASNEYVKVESRIANTPGSEAVLVSVDSLTSLERAYPNYFLDTTVFLRELEEVMQAP